MSKILKTYPDDIVAAMPNVVKEVVKDTVTDLKKRARKQFKGTKYNKSFKSRKLSTASGQTTYTVYSTEYRLTHLLEKGHVIKNQTGRIYGVTQARPHWEPAESAAVEELEQRLTETVQEAN